MILSSIKRFKFIVLLSCCLAMAVDAFPMSSPSTTRQRFVGRTNAECLRTLIDSQRLCEEKQADLQAEREASKNRRQFLVGATSSLLILLNRPPQATADGISNNDLSSQLYNPDGSLKDGVSSEVAKTRLVSFQLDASDERIVNIDGDTVTSTTTTTTGSSADSSSQGIPSNKVQVSYELPGKWGTGNELYMDKSEGVNAPACKRITVYKAANKASSDDLEKATTIGIGKALQVQDSKLTTADLIGGRKVDDKKNQQEYYQFDLAFAPKTCVESSPENLGLGFCPYESIFLVSATLLDNNLYVMVMECDNAEWKQGNADLKRVRSSFTVTNIS